MVKKPLKERHKVMDTSNMAIPSKMETCKKSSIYHPSKENKWTGINWSKIEKTIDDLQHRITKATERGEHRKVRDLQRLLTKSLSARLKAVRQVSQENSGKKTPGIDGEVWTTSDRKLQAAIELNHKTKTKPLKRVYIPKSNGKQRPLGIPCLSDRAKEAVWNMALLPRTEATSDPHSYGFRPYRDCWDANAQLRVLLDKKRSPTWILDADIEKCFDQINHEWLLQNTPMEKKQLKSWLKAGYFEGEHLFPTKERTPQGGVISPTLSNLALNGLEDHLKQKFQPKRTRQTSCTNSVCAQSTCINVVRYADNFVVTGRSQRQLERVKKEIQNFLAVRGLKINEKKTSIRHISDGFDFLGWHFRKYNGALLITISKSSISKHKKEIKYLTKTIHKPDVMIPKINEKIRGWMNYNRCCNDIWDVWSELNQYLYICLLKWGVRRHGSKTRKWIFNKYWKHTNGRWTFSVTTGRGRDEKVYTLIPYKLKQKRIKTRISAGTNVFDKANKPKLQKVALIKSTNLTGKKDKIWKQQKGLCAYFA